MLMSMPQSLLPILLALWLCPPPRAFAVAVPPTDDLALAFHNPPASARPWVYWFWNNDYVTKEGITADLEAMKRVGIGGVLVMAVGYAGSPLGPVTFGSLVWRGMFQYACTEARRLGLQVNMTNDAGCTGSGGPWMTPTPELSMQKVVWTETGVEGPRRAELKLPQPLTSTWPTKFYRDIVVLAFPTPAGQFRIDQIERKALWPSGGAVGNGVIRSQAVWPTATGRCDHRA